MLEHNPLPLYLRRIQLAVAAGVALAFPAATMLVFTIGVARQPVADALASVYAGGIWILLLAPVWLRVDAAHRLEWMVRVWVWLTSLTHLTWELGWLVLRDSIIAARDEPWAYAWWAYIDGGDLRYGTTDPVLWMMELLSVGNGLLGIIGLWLWYRRPARRRQAVLCWIAQAVVHLYATSLYFGSEIVAGFPNVDTTRIYDIGVKFIFANTPWLVFPVVVLIWGTRILLRPQSAA